MATVTEPQPPLAVSAAEESKTPTSPASRFRLATLLGLVLIGSAPLLYWHIAGLLLRPHYQFLVFLPICVWLLLPEATDNEQSPHSWLAAGVGGVMLASGLMLLAAASFLWSPWIGAVATLFSSGGCILWLRGWAGVRAYFPAWFFCWLVIPPPFGLDEDLIVYLRTVTTRMTSRSLDQFGVLHLSYANVIELPGKSLFIADACSGIHSLYVLSAVALFVGLWFRRGFLHTLLLLLSTFGIVLLENITRLVVVALALEWQVDLSEGIEHTFLGIGLFGLSLMLVLTTDQLLMFLRPTLPFLPRWFPKPQKLQNALKDGPSDPAPRRQMLILLAVAGVFPFLGAYQLARLPADPPDLIALYAEDLDLPPLGRDALPDQIAGFQLVDYKTIQRVSGDPFGTKSQQWSFRQGDLTGTISLDYPYDSMHDACLCYTLTGWTISEKEVLDGQALQARQIEAQAPVALGRMHRNLEGDALLLFSLVDTQGNEAAVIKDLARGDTGDRVRDRAAAFLPVDTRVTSDATSPMRPPFLQFQLLGRSPNGFDQQQEQQLVELFVKARALLRTQCLDAIANATSSSDQ